MSEEFDTPPIPAVIEPSGLNDYFEVMTRAVFQAGVSWAQIAKRWNSYGRAFDNFDVVRVAAYDSMEVERVLAEPGILRMRRKVDATIANAAALIKVQTDFGSFHDYVASFDTYEALAKDVKRRFKFMGDMNVWYLLFRVGEPVPRLEPWLATIDGEHPRMREMVEAARASGRSSERAQ